MELQKNNFFKLLSSVIQNQPMPALQKPVDWHAILSVAKEHNLQSLIFERAGTDYEFQSQPEHSYWQRSVITSVVGQAYRTELFLQLYSVLLKADLHPVVMKGIICRQLYGKLCDHRPSGDEDLLIPISDFARVKQVLEEQGYKTEYANETQQQLERIQEVDFFHKKENFHIEVHLNAMGRENAFRAKMSDCFQNVFEHAIDVEIQGVQVRTLAHTDHLLYLVFHALKHLSGGGFGLRQVIDILLYQERFGAEVDWNEFGEKLRSIQAESFWSDLVHIGNTYLGFALEAPLEPNCPDELLEEIMASGAFGNRTMAEKTAAKATIAAFDSPKSGAIGRMFRAIFPPRAMLINQYPYLQENPWMLPIEWVKRWSRYIKRSKASDENLSAESIKISNRKIALLKKYNLL